MPTRRGRALAGPAPDPALDLETLRAVNAIVLSARHPWPGRWRDTDGVVRLDGVVRARLCPPDVGIERTRAAVSWLNQRHAGDTRPPSVATARELMFRIVTAHPFADGNGRTGRARAAWLLLTDGYRLRGDPEAYCGQHKAACYEALAGAQHTEPTRPPEAWNVFFGGVLDHYFQPPERGGPARGPSQARFAAVPGSAADGISRGAH